MLVVACGGGGGDGLGRGRRGSGLWLWALFICVSLPMRVLLLEYIYQLDCLLDCFAALWAYLIEDGLEWLRFPSAGRRTDVITNTLVPSGSNGNLNLIHTYVHEVYTYTYLIEHLCRH